MSGKRLLDIAALFSAFRGVAQKHVALRTRQLDVYSRTSSLAKGVRSQTDRVTETVKAASFLASRLNETAPTWTAEATADQPSSQSSNGDPIPSRKSTETGEPNWNQEEGLEQDHFYTKPGENFTADRQSTENLEIEQEKVGRYPLPNGTTPPGQSNINTASINRESTLVKPRHEPAKEPLDSDELEIQQERAGRHPLPDGTVPPTSSDLNQPETDQAYTSNRPMNETIKKPLSDEGVRPASYGASTIPLPSTHQLSPNAARTLQRQSEQQIPSQTADAKDKSTVDPTEDSNLVQIPSVEAVPEQERLPEGINTDLFHSPRVARLLGGKTHASRERYLKPRGVKNTPVECSSLNAGKYQDSFNVCQSSQNKPSSPEISTLAAVEVLRTLKGGSNDVMQVAQEISNASTNNGSINIEHESAPHVIPHALRESKVPASRLGRLWNYGGLAAGMFGGAISESIRRVGGNGGEGSFMLSAANMDRLVTKLSRMRGAALKLGQMLSFQDSKMLPAPIQEVLQRVQDRADYMPPSQRNKVLAANLGNDWRELFTTFEEVPLAAASIGQVHSATLKSTGQRVAVKIQYPGVADSIDSDLNNLAILLTASRLLPKGLFLDKTIANARTELAWECDYIREAECGRRFQELLAGEKDIFVVPKVFPEASGKQVLTMEFLDGVGVTRVRSFTQEQKDWIGTQILRLCLREITEFRFMQTDPNWTNFLYNAQTNKLELLDFGASREYPQEFITNYTKLLLAASQTNKESVRDLSIQLGYLTGHESKAMLDAHIASVLTLAEPFLASSPEVYDFKDQTITERVKQLIPVMIRERLAPPPEETYSLHRKLSGAFLLCARLGSRVRCRDLFVNSMKSADL